MIAFKTCHFCKAPLGDEGYVTFDLNSGAAASGAGNYAYAHSRCHPGFAPSSTAATGETPRTDANLRGANIRPTHPFVEFCRQLERELAEAEWKAHHREQMVEQIRADFRELQGRAMSSPSSTAATEERWKAIHEHDCPKFKDFYMKHAMGSKLCPSCLLCGKQRFNRAEEWAITHAELPDIYICKPCVDAARAPVSARVTQFAFTSPFVMCEEKGDHWIEDSSGIPLDRDEILRTLNTLSSLPTERGESADTKRLNWLQTTVEYTANGGPSHEANAFLDNHGWLDTALIESEGDLRKAIDAVMAQRAEGGTK